MDYDIILLSITELLMKNIMLRFVREGLMEGVKTTRVVVITWEEGERKALQQLQTGVATDRS